MELTHYIPQKAINMKFFYSIVLMFLFCQSHSGNAQIETEPLNSYHLEFGDLESRSISVKSKLYIEGDELRMIPRPEQFFPDIKSWWDLIDINNLKDENGKNIEIINIDGDKAILNRKINGILNISYTLDISYVDKNYPNLNSAIGKSFKEGLFIVGKPLFIFGKWGIKTKVTISKPKDVKITVPWQKVENYYWSPSLYRLVYSNIIVSDPSFGVTDFSVKQLSYSLATFNLDEQSISLILEIAHDVANYYVTTFPFDHDIRYVQLIYGVSGNDSGGEAYPNSSASAIPDNISASHLWRITIFHELFHMWNSAMLKGVTTAKNMEWLNEGFTDYMTEIALSKTGHIDSSVLTNYQEMGASRFLRSFENKNAKVSIKNSGFNKGENYTIVYKGGWLIAKWLDSQFVTKTNNQWSVERLFRHLFRKYPQQGNKKLSFDAFIDEIARINQQIAEDLKVLLNTTDLQVLRSYLF